MAKKRNKKSIAYPVFFMILVSVIFTLALAFINEITIDTIKGQDEFKNEKTLLYVFGISYDSTMSRSEVEQIYSARISEIPLKNSDITVYKATDGDSTVGYAFPIEGKGLWGTIKGYIALDKDFGSIVGLDFISHSETPGLGGRISELWFKDQFRGIPITDEAAASLSTIIYRPSDGGNAEPITGATLTSDSVRKMLNQSIKDIVETLKGEI